MEESNFFTMFALLSSICIPLGAIGAAIQNATSTNEDTNVFEILRVSKIVYVKPEFFLPTTVLMSLVVSGMMLINGWIYLRYYFGDSLFKDSTLLAIIAHMLSVKGFIITFLFVWLGTIYSLSLVRAQKTLGVILGFALFVFYSSNIIHLVLFGLRALWSAIPRMLS